jgi:hypothetical protein
MRSTCSSGTMPARRMRVRLAHAQKMAAAASTASQSSWRENRLSPTWIGCNAAYRAVCMAGERPVPAAEIGRAAEGAEEATSEHRLLAGSVGSPACDRRTAQDWSAEWAKATVGSVRTKLEVRKQDALFRQQSGGQPRLCTRRLALYGTLNYARAWPGRFLKAKSGDGYEAGVLDGLRRMVRCGVGARTSARGCAAD